MSYDVAKFDNIRGSMSSISSGSGHNSANLSFKNDSVEDTSNSLGKSLMENTEINSGAYRSSFSMASSRSTMIIEKDSDIASRMWSKELVGLYCHYAAVGLNGGIQGILSNFCFFYFNGDSNVCGVAYSIVYIPWSFKLFIAMFSDSYRPFGLRRKPYMIVGWVGVLLITLIIGIFYTEISVNQYIILGLISQLFLMVADVSADGYSVELGQLEAEDQRGQILVTGQRIRFGMTLFAGIIQAVLVNGVTTNAPDCPISFLECWSFGLTVGQYYFLTFVVMLTLFIPILFLKEPSTKNIPLRNFTHHAHDLWDTLQNKTTLYLLIFVFGTNMLSSLQSVASIYLQYDVIQLTNFQSGIDTITTFGAVMFGVWLFQKYFINRNWRTTQYLSIVFSAILGCLWLPAYNNTWGLLDGWYTIFINLSQSFAQGISQVLFAMAVIELAKPGQEAITYELIISAANSAGTLNLIVGTQLLNPFGANGCTTDSCPSDTVDCSDRSSYFSSDGPRKWSTYTYVVLGINLLSVIFFTQFLPSQKKQCHEWREEGINNGTQKLTGYLSVTLASVVILYGIVATLMLLDPSTSCLPIFGGSGC